jgi:glyoxylase-like metal-dependent hydrolase (beta-lactamase superfamily II)
MTVDLGGVEVRLIRTAPSHTAGSVVAYVPSQKLLFAGDILFTDFHPFLADGDMAGWTGTIDSLLGMDVERIVPGHGPLSTKKDLREMREYLLLFDGKARELAAASKDEGRRGAAAEHPPEALPGRVDGGVQREEPVPG